MDGIILNDDSTSNTVRGNVVSDVGWQAYYVNGESNNNLYENNIARDCGGGLDLWSSYDNTFRNLRIERGVEIGITFANYLSGTEDRKYNYFEDLTFSCRQDNTQLLHFWDSDPENNPFPAWAAHSFKMSNTVFEMGTEKLVFNETGEDYSFSGTTWDEFPYYLVDVDDNGMMDMRSKLATDDKLTVHNLGAMGCERRYYS